MLRAFVHVGLQLLASTLLETFKLVCGVVVDGLSDTIEYLDAATRECHCRCRPINHLTKEHSLGFRIAQCASTTLFLQLLAVNTSWQPWQRR
jgi:hypothetical protein